MQLYLRNYKHAVKYQHVAKNLQILLILILLKYLQKQPQETPQTMVSENTHLRINFFNFFEQ